MGKTMDYVLHRPANVDYLFDVAEYDDNSLTDNWGDIEKCVAPIPDTLKVWSESI